MPSQLNAAHTLPRVRERPATPKQKRLFKVLRSTASASETLRDAASLIAAPMMEGHNARAASASTSELRTVYESGNITTGILPTTQGLCFVSVVAGINSSLCTTTASAAKGGLGLLVSQGHDYYLTGVLVEGAKRAVVEEASGARVETPLDGEDGYAVALESAPRLVVVTEEDGSVYKVGPGAQGEGNAGAQGKTNAGGQP